MPNPHQPNDEQVERLLDELAQRTNKSREEIHNAFKKPLRHQIDAHAILLYALAVFIGLVCLRLSVHITPHELPPNISPAIVSELEWRKWFEHLGVAFVIAATVALVFHFAHEKKLISHPIEKMERGLDKLEHKTNDIYTQVETQTQKLSDTLSSFSNVMQYAKDKGITGAYVPRSPDWVSAITELIDNAQETLYISARSLRPFLLDDRTSETTGWMGKVLAERLEKTPDLNLAVLLADVFDTRSEYREELKGIFAYEALNEDERKGCRDAVAWFIDLMSWCKRETAPCRVSLRLLGISPPLFVILSEKEAIVGHYMPFKALDSVRMVKLEASSELFKDFKDYFETFFARGMEPRASIKKFLLRHNNEGDLTKHWKDVLNTLEGLSCTNPALLQIVQKKAKWLTSVQFRGVGPTDIRTSENPTLVRSYTRGDARYIAAAQEAVEKASQSLCIIGRCHGAMLGEGYGDAAGAHHAAWLYPSLLEMLKRTERKVPIVIILPNTFTNEQTEFKDDITAIASYGSGKLGALSAFGIMDITRKTVAALLDFQIHELLPENIFRIRLIPQSPRVCMVMTEETAFYELYMPGQDGGATEINQVQSSVDGGQTNSQYYQSLRMYMENLDQASTTVDALSAVEQFCRTGTSEMSREFQRKLDLYHSIFPQHAVVSQSAIPPLPPASTHSIPQVPGEPF